MTRVQFKLTSLKGPLLMFLLVRLSQIPLHLYEGVQYFTQHPKLKYKFHSVNILSQAVQIL